MTSVTIKDRIDDASKIRKFRDIAWPRDLIGLQLMARGPKGCKRRLCRLRRCIT